MHAAAGAGPAPAVPSAAPQPPRGAGTAGRAPAAQPASGGGGGGAGSPAQQQQQPLAPLAHVPGGCSLALPPDELEGLGTALAADPARFLDMSPAGRVLGVKSAALAAYGASPAAVACMVATYAPAPACGARGSAASGGDGGAAGRSGGLVQTSTVDLDALGAALSGAAGSVSSGISGMLHGSGGGTGTGALGGWPGTMAGLQRITEAERRRVLAFFSKRRNQATWHSTVQERFGAEVRAPATRGGQLPDSARATRLACASPVYAPLLCCAPPPHGYGLSHGQALSPAFTRTHQVAKYLSNSAIKQALNSTPMDANLVTTILEW